MTQRKSRKVRSVETDESRLQQQEKTAVERRSGQGKVRIAIAIELDPVEIFSDIVDLFLDADG